MAAYKLTAAAEDDLGSIFFEGIVEFGLAHAAAYRDQLIRTFDFLSEHPFAARIREEITPAVRA